MQDLHWIEKSVLRLQGLEKKMQGHSSFVPLVTGSTPVNPIPPRREEKSDRVLLGLYFENFHWFAKVGSRKVDAARTIVCWKLDALGGLGAAW